MEIPSLLTEMDPEMCIRDRSMGFEAVLMSGSGSTVFAITRNEELLLQAEKQFHKERYFVCCTAVKQ